jgi:hypothetical protein
MAGCGRGRSESDRGEGWDRQQRTRDQFEDARASHSFCVFQRFPQASPGPFSRLEHGCKLGRLALGMSHDK